METPSVLFCVLMFKTIKLGFQLPPHEDVSARIVLIVPSGIVQDIIVLLKSF